MVRGKKGDEKYYIIISLILGLLVLGLSLFYIFEEYFTEDDVNWETCRQSIVLRNSVSVDKSGSITKEIFSDYAKDLAPLKCKNDVARIGVILDGETGTTKDIDKIIIEDYRGRSEINVGPEKSPEVVLRDYIGGRLEECWKLWGEGEYAVFPGNIVFEKKDCAICSRISFSEELKNIWYTPTVEVEKMLSDEQNKKIVQGDEVPISMIFYRSSLASFNKKMRYAESFKFSDDENWESSETGSRRFVFPSKGDLLLGMYFYTNKNYFEDFDVINYVASYPFYVQLGIEEDKKEFKKCSVESIPA